MNQFHELQTTAGELYNSTESKKWIFAHTRDETEFQAVRRALKILSNWKPVEWQGTTGKREPMEVTV